MEFYSMLVAYWNLINTDEKENGEKNYNQIQKVRLKKLKDSLDVQSLIANILAATHLGSTLNAKERQIIEEILLSKNPIIEEILKDTSISGDIRRKAELYKELEAENFMLAQSLKFNLKDNEHLTNSR